jgi:hypothetical protein
MRQRMHSELMTPEHPAWEAFIARLAGPEGCNFHEDARGELRWRCRHNTRLAQAILARHFPTVDRAASLAFFAEHGGYCDCEIVFNVAPDDQDGC